MKPTADQQAWINQYCREVIDAYLAAAYEAQAKLDDGEPVLEVWKVLQAPLVGISVNMLLAMTRGPKP